MEKVNTEKKSFPGRLGRLETLRTLMR